MSALAELMRELISERIDHLVASEAAKVKAAPPEMVSSLAPVKTYKSFDMMRAGLKRTRTCAVKRAKRIQEKLEAARADLLSAQEWRNYMVDMEDLDDEVEMQDLIISDHKRIIKSLTMQLEATRKTLIDASGKLEKSAVLRKGK